MRKNEISSIMISFFVEKERKFHLFLSRDGIINRQGTGLARLDDNDLYSATTQEPLFGCLIDSIPREWPLPFGYYQAKNKPGNFCELKIIFSSPNGKEEGYLFHYGSDSSSVPSGIMQFVLMAKNITEPWYEEQLSKAQKDHLVNLLGQFR
jgi:hypothetical protein